MLALSRLRIHPDVPANACSFLLSKSIRLIDRTKWHTLVTYADSWQGHTGGIYRASGWEYCGETSPSPMYTLDDRMLGNKRSHRVGTLTHAEVLAMGAIYHGRHAKSRFKYRD